MPWVASEDMDIDAAVAGPAGSQLGVFTRGQADAAGATRAIVRQRLASGRWVQMHPRVFRIAGAPTTWEQALLAAWLAAGAGAVASHRAAARVWGLPGVAAEIELTLPPGKDPVLRGVRVHRTRTLAPVDIVARDGLLVTSATRTIIDLSAVLDRAALGRVLDHCLARHLTSARFLQRRLDSAGRQGRVGTAVLDALLAERPPDRRGPESELERRLLSLLSRLPGPPPVPQYEVGLPGGRRVRLDAAYPDIRLGIEADSYVHHSSATDWSADHTRSNALVAAGWRILPVTWGDVHDRPEGLLDLVARARDTRTVRRIGSLSAISPNGSADRVTSGGAA